MEYVAVWVFLAAFIGYWASQKGRSGLGWFALAVLLSPLIAGLFLLVSESKPATRTRVNPPPVTNPPQPVTPPPAPTPRDNVAVLNALTDLRERGLLNEDEYQTKKTEVLARL